MPGSRIKTQGPGHVRVDDKANAGTIGRVNTDGQINVKFHSNPKQLAAWFERFEDAFQQRPKQRRSKSCKFADSEKPLSSPRLNIAIHIVGSRGDVQPFIPIAQLLSKPPYGHRVRICTHPVFKDFVESSGVEFFSIGGDPEALMAYMVKNPGLLPSKESYKAGDVGKRMKEMAEIMDGVWRSCIEAGNGMGERRTAANVASARDLFVADAIIANPPSMAHLHCAEKLNIPLHMVFTMPWSPTKVFHHPLAAMNYGDADPSVANYLSFMMMELLTWEGLGAVINVFRKKTLRLTPINPMWGYQLLSRMRVPYTYLWSQSLIPKPSDWDSHIKITGFSFLPLASSYTPPPDLTEFLAKGPAPVYIGFGSIVVDDPQALTHLILEAVNIAGVRAIVSKGWGGVGGGEVPKNVYLIGNCPHDWLFQHVSAVVHHGGAGTTAAGIAAGRPTVVVPFFGDQPFWGQMIAQAGAGPVPVPFKQMTAETLAASITFALKPEVQVAVHSMAEQIAKENGAVDTAQDVQDRMDINEFRCDLFPNRLAVWHYKRTNTQLSGFAASTLVQRNVIQPEHLKLIRRKHWYIDEGAEHPVVGAVASVTGSFRAIIVATSIYKQNLKSKPIPNKGDESTIMGEAIEAKMEELEVVPGRLSQKQMQELAMKMASKSLHRGYSNKSLSHTSSKSSGEVHTVVVNGGQPKPKERVHVKNIVRASGQYAAAVTKIGLTAPGAFFYNVANGFHNWPSYGFWSTEVRRRDEVTGVSSGVRTAGKEFVLGFYDALSGIVLLPVQGARQEGVPGLGKGVFRAFRGLICNVGAAAYGLPGYTLKGIEMGLSRRKLTKIVAEIYLIRLRQSIEDFRDATEEEREEVELRWKELHS